MTPHPTSAAFEALPHGDARRPWLIGLWSWRVVNGAGALLADGEGCPTAGAAIEAARAVAREERLTGDAEMNARIERVVRSMLDDDLTPPIMLRFTSREQFRNFIRKVLVTGNVRK